MASEALTKIKDILSIILKILGLLFLIITGTWLIAKFVLPKNNVLWRTIQVWVSNPQADADSGDADKIEAALKQILGR